MLLSQHPFCLNESENCLNGERKNATDSVTQYQNFKLHSHFENAGTFAAFILEKLSKTHVLTSETAIYLNFPSALQQLITAYIDLYRSRSFS